MQQLSLIPVCEKCGEPKQWRKDASHKDGGRFRCRSCMNSYLKGRYHDVYKRDPDSAHHRQLRKYREDLEYREERKVQMRAYGRSEAGLASAARARERRPERYRHSAKNANLRRNYGIDIHDWERLWEAQGGICPICDKPLIRDGGTHGRDSTAVDHCHETGKVRGLLHMLCNVGIGQLGEDVDTFERAIRYIEKHRNEASLGTTAGAAA